MARAKRQTVSSATFPDWSILKNIKDFKAAKLTNPIAKLAAEIGVDPTQKDFLTALAEWVDEIRPPEKPLINPNEKVAISDSTFQKWLRVAELEEQIKEMRKLEEERRQLLEAINAEMGTAAVGVCRHGLIEREVKSRRPYFVGTAYWIQVRGIPSKK